MKDGTEFKQFVFLLSKDSKKPNSTDPYGSVTSNNRSTPVIFPAKDGYGAEIIIKPILIPGLRWQLVQFADRRQIEQLHSFDDRKTDVFDQFRAKLRDRELISGRTQSCSRHSVSVDRLVPDSVEIDLADVGRLDNKFWDLFFELVVFHPRRGARDR